VSEFSITILGNNSAIPRHGRHPSAQFLKIGNQSILVDCGEGTQKRLRDVPKTNLFQISHIFISHLHGDHYLGIVGLISSLGLMRKTKPLHIYAHEPLQEIFRMQIELMGHALPYEIIFHPLPLAGDALICDTAQFSVQTFQLDHRGPTCGFRFEEKISNKKINKEALEKYEVPIESWNDIQQGGDYTTKDNVTISNSELTLKGPKPRTYAYCSDTKYTETILPFIKGIDTVYIESTYTDKEEKLAAERFHCTARQAATLAKKAGVGRLLLGHFSSRYKKVDIYQKEAREVFSHSEIAEEGKTFQIELW